MKLLTRSSICIMQCTTRMLCSTATQSAVNVKTSKNYGNRFYFQNFINSDSIMSKQLRDLQLKIGHEHYKQYRAELMNNYNLTEINVDSQVMDLLTFYHRNQLAIDYVKFLRNNNIDINLGVTGKYLKSFFYRQTPLTKEEEEEICKLYDGLRKKYSLLDFDTTVSCILGLSLTKRWSECIELLDMLKYSGSPNCTVYRAIICAALNNNQLNIAWKYMKNSLPKTPIDHHVFLAYLNYCQLNSKHQNLQKNIDKMFLFWRENNITPTEVVLDAYCKVYENFGYKADKTFIPKKGYCLNCDTNLPPTTLSSAEFKTLSVSILKNVIIGENLFCSTSPQELKKYMLFIQTLNSYDVVIDGLNVAYSSKRDNTDKKGSLLSILDVVKNFVKQRKRTLVIGRAHMMWWNKEVMKEIQELADVYVVKNISQDDPFLLHVTLVSGPQTYFVSRDLMRSHKARLDPSIQNLFKRWQLSRQYLFNTDLKNMRLHLIPPIVFDIAAQQNDNGWHIPYVQNNDLTQPDLYQHPRNWICMKKTRK